MSTWMIFRTMIWRHELTDCWDAASMATRKAQHNFALHFHGLGGNQGCTILRKTAAKHARYVK
jgi:hypothetical protein